MNSIVSEKQFIQSRLGIPYENLSQSYLRAETKLSTNSVINFSLQRNQVQSPLSTERLLELNDQFVITHFAIASKIFVEAAQGEATVVADADAPTANDQLVAQLFTYFDPISFAGTNTVNIAALWNGSLNFTINRKEFLPNFPCRSFLRKPATQAGTLDLAGSGVGVNAYDNGLYSFYPSEPTLIDGRQTLDIFVDLQSSVAFDDADKSVWAVLELRGYLVVNAKS